MKKTVFIALLFLVGCSPFEFARLLGTGTRPFKEGRTYSKIFEKDLYTSYDEVILILRKMGTRFIRGRRDKGFIVSSNFNDYYRFCIESTEVAVFFNELEKNKTRVKVASLNYSLAEFIAQQVFNGLEGKPLDQSYRLKAAEDKSQAKAEEKEEEVEKKEAGSKEQAATEQESEEKTEEEKE